jgi:hypothetical protein
VLTCGNCRFWHETNVLADGYREGECRRRAPAPGDGRGRWSRTSHQQWCGEHEPKEAKPMWPRPCDHCHEPIEKSHMVSTVATREGAKVVHFHCAGAAGWR